MTTEQQKLLECPTCKAITSKTLTIDGTYICDDCGNEWDSGF